MVTIRPRYDHSTTEVKTVGLPARVWAAVLSLTEAQ